MYQKEEIRDAWKLAREKGITYFGSVGSNPKTIKSDKLTRFLTWLMYLAPANQSGRNVCPMASPGCTKACLFTAGHGRYQNVQKARIRRTDFWFDHREEFKRCVFSEIYNFTKYAERAGKKPAVRLNGTSDIVWEVAWPEIFQWFPNVIFYDYTKVYQRLLPGWKLPNNYRLTLSRSEVNDKHIQEVIDKNPTSNVAVVFDNLPKKWKGRRVINGDWYDARFLDPKGVIVGLIQKGRAKHDHSGFVIRHENNISELILPTIEGKPSEKH
jgi:hypothetical protein